MKKDSQSDKKANGAALGSAEPSGFGEEISCGLFDIAGRTGAAGAAHESAQQYGFEGNVSGCGYVQVGAELCGRGGGGGEC